jgi:hypothetical protein
VRFVGYSPSGALLAATGDDRIVHVWSTDGLPEVPRGAVALRGWLEAQTTADHAAIVGIAR